MYLIIALLTLIHFIPAGAEAETCTKVIHETSHRFGLRDFFGFFQIAFSTFPFLIAWGAIFREGLVRWKWIVFLATMSAVLMAHGFYLLF